MKKSLHFLTSLSLLVSLVFLAPGASAWSETNIAVSVFSGTNKEEPRAIKVDSNGNIFTTGLFFGTVDFDPSDGTTNLTALGDREIFVSKMDSSGNLLWAKRFGGEGPDCGNSVSLDSSGNIYIAGNFSLTADFDPGAGVANLTSAGLEDAFVLKLDSSGNYLWAKNIAGSAGYDNATMALDSNGNGLITGRFFGTVDFDPGLGTSSLLSSGNSDIFILKLDSSGNFLWAKSFGDTNGDAGNSIAVDSIGYVYTTGQFKGTIDFDPGPGKASITAGSDDVFISKLDSFGNYVWAKRIGGEFGDYSYSIQVDGSGNVYTAGQFSGIADFDPGLGTSSFLSNGNSDIFISKLDSSGDYLWAKRIGGIALDAPYSITVDSGGNFYTTGVFRDTVDFDPGEGTSNLASTDTGGGVFILKLDSSGAYVWAKSIDGLTADIGRSITTDSAGHVYTTGSFTGTVDLNPGAGTANFSSIGDSDIFILKLDSSGNAPLVAIVSAGTTPNSKVATIPSGGTEAAISATSALPAIKLNFGGTVPTAVTVVPVAANPASVSATPFTLGSSKIVDIQITGGSFSGSVTVCLDGASTDRLYHYTGGAWVELGSRNYVNGQVCGVTTSFSPFVAAAPVVAVAPMIPFDKPVVTQTAASIMCTMGTHSAIPTSSVFSLFVDGEHISTNFSAVGDYLPSWIIPWANAGTILRTASLTSATWAMNDAYKGKSITCTTLAYSAHATGLTSSEKVTIK